MIDEIHTAAGPQGNALACALLRQSEHSAQSTLDVSACAVFAMEP